MLKYIVLKIMLMVFYERNVIMKVITREELKKRMDGGEDFAIPA